MGKRGRKEKTFGIISCLEAKNKEEWQALYDAAIKKFEKNSAKRGMPDEFMVINPPWMWTNREGGHGNGQ